MGALVGGHIRPVWCCGAHIVVATETRRDETGRMSKRLYLAGSRNDMEEWCLAQCL
jgi:hypothetical protein